VFVLRIGWTFIFVDWPAEPEHQIYALSDSSKIALKVRLIQAPYSAVGDGPMAFVVQTSLVQSESNPW
jgi:hypothetical protein